MRHFQHVVRVVWLRVFLLGLVLAGASPLALSVDVFKKATTPYVQFLNVPWGNGGGAFNNTFWFNVLAPEQGVCVYITNNNPTNGHPFSTFSVSTTANPTVPGFTGFTRFWTSVPSSTPIALPVTINLSSTQAFFFPARGAAFVAVTFGGSTSLAGNPDTANIIMVLEDTTSCGTSGVFPVVSVIGAVETGSAIAIGSTDFPVLIGGLQQVSGVEQATALFADVDSTSRSLIVGTQASMTDRISGWGQWVGNVANGNLGMAAPTMPNYVGDDSANPPISFFMRGSKRFGLMESSPWAWAANTDGIGTGSAYVAQRDSVNPTAGLELLGVFMSASSLAINPARATISCSAACDILINKTSTVGTTCTAVTPIRAADITIEGVFLGVANTACTVAPTVQGNLMHIWLGANTIQVIDLTGYWTSGGTTWGFDFVEGAAVAAGTVSISLEFSDRCAIGCD